MMDSPARSTLGYSVTVDLDRRTIVVGISDSMNTLFVQASAADAKNLVQALNRAIAFVTPAEEETGK